MTKNVELFLSRWGGRLFTPLLLGVISLLFFSLYYVFMVVPDEKVMGPVQRIFYFHVGSAVACYVGCSIVFLASLGYLFTKNSLFDVANEAAGEVGFLFCSITLSTGMIWGHSAWNTWFRWEEPRLVTFLFLWLIFLGFFLMRNFAEPSKVRVQSAVMGILGAITVPLVWISIQFLPQTAQLHPQVIENRGLKDPSFYIALFISMIALICLELFLMLVRMRIGMISENMRK